jgi:hypothetical protein
MNKLIPRMLTLAVVLGAGCGGSTTTTDAAREAAADRAGSEVASDVGPAPDAVGTEVPDAAAPDQGSDVAADATTDLATDTPPVDAPADRALDLAPDLAADVPPPDAATPDVATPDLARDMAPDTALPDLGPSPDVTAGGEMFQARLRGGEVTPPVVTGASGTFTLNLDPGEAAFSYRLQQTVTGATSAALHLASAGEEGDVAVPLPLGADVSGTAALTAEQLTALKAGRLYVSVESAGSPDGEIRGQILRPGEREFVGDLTGAQQTPPVTTNGHGHATFILNAAGDHMLWRVVNTGLVYDHGNTNFSNVHRGVAGLVSHDVVFGLEPLGPNIAGDDPITLTERGQLERGLWSCDVHTTAFGNGEVRGQLIELAETLYTSILSGDNVVPAVVTAAEGGIGLILNADRSRIRYEGSVNGVTPTAVALRLGDAGENGTVVKMLSTSGTSISGDFPVTAADIAALDSDSWYVEVQSAGHPAGEIRGQLGRK